MNMLQVLTSKIQNHQHEKFRHHSDIIYIKHQESRLSQTFLKTNDRETRKNTLHTAILVSVWPMTFF